MMTMSKERLEEIKSVYEDYKGLQKKGDFKQADIALLYLSENHIDWLINRIDELEKQRNERTQLLNAEVARNARYKKVLEKIVNHAGEGIDIDYELWKMAKEALEGEK